MKEPTRIWNPPNKYLAEQREFLDQPDSADLEVYEDDSQSILAHNDSPDVGFSWSVNPYRGCFHSCAYCLSGDTLIAMADGRTKKLSDIRVGDEVYGTVVQGHYRRLVRTHVYAHWSVAKSAYRIMLEDGAELISSGDHRFLTDRGWKYVTGTEQGRTRRPHLTKNNRLLGIGQLIPPPKEDLDYKRGYLCGMIRGDGLLGSYDYSGRRRTNEKIHQFRLALIDQEALHRARGYLLNFGVPTYEFLFQKASPGYNPVRAIRTSSRPQVERIKDISGQATKNHAQRVVSIEALGFSLPMFDITTGTGDFIANGVVSHNCYARPTHEYFGLGAGTDFERKIFIKRNAPILLEQAFRRASWKGERVVFSGVTDCYQPLEAAWRLTRGCLQVCLGFRNPAAIITKSVLIRRDIDILKQLTREASVSVAISIPFLDEEIASVIEPGAPAIRRRFETLALLAEEGIAVGIGVAPIIPGLNDRDMAGLLREAKRCGAKFAFRTLLRLPGSVKEVFFHRLQEKLPMKAHKIEQAIRDTRGGGLYDSRFGHRHEGQGHYWQAIDQAWDLWIKRFGFDDMQEEPPERSPTFRRPPIPTAQKRVVRLPLAAATAQTEFSW